MKYQDFFSGENFVSSEDTSLSFTCENVTVVMATSVSANDIWRSYNYMRYCYNIQNTYKRYLFSLFFDQNSNCIRSNYFIRLIQQIKD